MKEYIGREQYWWCCTRPSIYHISEREIGSTVKQTWYNQLGNKRRIFPNFLAAKVGDIVVFYESSPQLAVVALGRIVAINGNESLLIEKTECIKPISYKTIKETEALKKMEFFGSPYGSFFRLTPNEFKAICELAE